MSSEPWTIEHLKAATSNQIISKQVVQGRIGNKDHLQQDTFLMVLKIYSTSNTMNISALRGCHKPASSEEAMLQNSQDTISLMRFFVFVVLKDVFTMPLTWLAKI